MRPPGALEAVTSVSWWISTPWWSARAGEPPDDGVVPDDPARRVVERAEDRIRGSLREVELRAELADLVRVDDLESIPRSLFTSARSCIVIIARSECASVRCPCCENIRLKSSSRRQALVELDALAVERRALGRAVVRADDRRVPPGRARADVRAARGRDVLDAVVLREVVRGREAVRAAADDHDVVAALQLVPRAPHPLREEDLLITRSPRDRRARRARPRRRSGRAPAARTRGTSRRRHAGRARGRARRGLPPGGARDRDR